MLTDYFHVLLFTIIGFAFGSVILLTAWLVRNRGTRDKDVSPYECGMDAVGTPWVSPNIRFYSFALLFVIFDVEVLFVFPWAVKFRELGMFGYVEVMIFTAILFVGLVYAWRRGALKWE